MCFDYQLSCKRRNRQRFALRRSFTLVEMLGAVVILGMLAAIAMGALQKVREEARRTKTRATVDKISRVIMAKYNSYRTRRVPCDVVAIATALYGPDSTTGQLEAKSIARVRLNALRELMRLEMPDRLTDVTNYPTSPRMNDKAVMLSLGLTSNPYYLAALPDATRNYQMAFRTGFANSGNKSAIIASHADAKCLYLIVTSDPEAAAQFREDEIAIVDTSGMSVFVDGWGNPIHFLRWPAGFVYEPNADPNKTLLGDSDIQTRARAADSTADHVVYVAPDPFDPWRVTVTYNSTGGYALYPLVYSAGPDGRDMTTSAGVRYTDGTDINIGKTGSSTYKYTLTTTKDLDPYVLDGSNPTPMLIGRPINNDSATATPRHYDNIHNHRLEHR
jgi:prepilin-type N-terminal cleavage/methylation domain-containing protein